MQDLIRRIEGLKNIDIIGYPRLVRLNPDIPWKTRGNGAICLKLGRGAGDRVLIAEINRRKYYGYMAESEHEEGGIDAENELERVRAIVETVVETHAWFQDETTNPAFVVSAVKPSYELYLRAVRSIVDLNHVERILRELDGLYHGYKNRRGLIGAASAIAWEPRRRTYEIMTYREKQRWGTKREIVEDSVIAMDKRFPFTFDNYDYNNRYICIAPNSPCPVLFGIRGWTPEMLPDAMQMIECEHVDCWVIFETNQGTDDHLTRRSISELRPYEPVIVSGTVISEPRTIRGGHVIFGIVNDQSSRARVDCAAYEPTKEFRNVIRELVVGDEITVFGGVRERPLTVNVEKIRINRLVKIREKVHNPICSSCGRAMKSMGNGQGYRCRTCGRRSKQHEARFREKSRRVGIGFYEVPPSARRHLSKPLKLMNSRG